MVIEWLQFQMAPEHRERFIAADTEIWTDALTPYPGFVAKEVWITPEDETTVVVVVRWASREQWKAIPEAEVRRIEQQFQTALDFEYTLVASSEYQVRRFQRPN
ncbi:hypothetical protein XM38_050520 [Halomicronema hongdechloris C2206]|uniref:ABM domain-containing protein n=1 Tax=Halomicronema hongdechloris C2206 TaxID=1641165 RepID=A0A1Z3HUT3_9CYAN|nr:TIGR03792 family protein [Halomicronema hongdechloris]ASC74078.1 hypothetical protein XM38_050520 [Halomicronema hongdechloris C2206]